jgi:hypothetical protein
MLLQPDRTAHDVMLNNNQRLKKLQAEYRARWDAHQALAHQNATLVLLGKQPTNEQLINEQRAADAVALARTELLAATAKAGGP